MLDQDFCTTLEYKLSEAFSNSTDQAIRSFWCDGILSPSSEYEISKKHVNDTREIVMTAFIGLDGQGQHKLTLKFGRKALSRYARDLDIKECIPDVTDEKWYEVDTTKKTIAIYLL